MELLDFGELFCQYRERISSIFDQFVDYCELNKLINQFVVYLNNNREFTDYIDTKFNLIIGKTVFNGSDFVLISRNVIIRSFFLLSLECDLIEVEKKLLDLKNGYELKYLIPLIGVCLGNKEKIQLVEGIELIDIFSLQISNMKTTLIRNIKGDDNFGRISPYCVLNIEIGKFDLCTDDEKQQELSRKAIENKIIEKEQYYKDVLAVLPIVLGEGYFTYGMTKYEVQDIFIDDESFFIINEALGSPEQNIYTKNNVLLQENKINKRIIIDYLLLPRNMKELVSWPINYYNKYLIYRYSQYAEAGIFLRLTLESLLLDGSSGNTPKVCHRAAYLINDNKDRIRQCNDYHYIDDVRLFRLIYSSCSSFIHTESFYSKCDPFSTQIEKKFLNIISKSINKVFLGFIEEVSKNLPDIENKLYPREYLFCNKVKAIKDQIGCKQSKVCYKIDSFEETVDLLRYFEINNQKNERLFFLVGIFRKFKQKLLEENSKNYNSSNIFNDLEIEPPHFTELLDTSAAFLAAIIDSYCVKKGHSSPIWTGNYSLATWKDLQGNEIVPSDSSKMDPSYVNKKINWQLLF